MLDVKKGHKRGSDLYINIFWSEAAVLLSFIEAV